VQTPWILIHRLAQMDQLAVGHPWPIYEIRILIE
jgi:hypothetical protein